jgi:RNA polymerase sigma-70 factor (ECF subfamily)
MPGQLDEDLLKRFVQGDRDAFEVLFRQFEADVHRWIARIVRDSSAADDCLVEAFWRAYRGHARFDPSRSFGAWMRRIATNTARDHLKRTKPFAGWTTAYNETPAPPPADGDIGELVRRALGALPPRLQVVATLALVEELPYTEIAEALDMPVGTVKSRVFRATRALRKELARLGIQS